MSADLKEIRIVGGGLAGLSLGIGLCRNGIPARVYEGGTYPRHKVCGEFIAGLSRETIEALGIAESLEGAVMHREVAWFRNGKAFRRDRLPRSAYGISRFRLDARLAETFRGAGGSLICGERVGLESITQEGTVWAAGRERTPSEWVGVKLHCRSLELMADLEVHLGQDAYAGASAVEDGRVNVCALMKRRKTRTLGRRTDAVFDLLSAAGLEALADRVREADSDVASCTSVAGLGFGRVEFGDGCIRIGDAYALIPPFTGDGMAMALEGAAAALGPLVRFARGEADWASTTRVTAQALDTAFRRRLAVARFVHPFLHGKHGQPLFRAASATRLLPFSPLFNLLH